ncbi:DUF2332 domain-containing protein [Actinocatenispora sera]|uniref:DUF2332 domain-containing protein n=1 Tax=Actinocatenispora sera TaxID=390989 RepID=A0A810KUK4_9ACTN|nr:DUF2332 domain-containing protein [Actinocatenispora sera]BCJ26039.1 hypothetical protein Asera_01470 [Actinocatenispora sera]
MTVDDVRRPTRHDLAQRFSHGEREFPTSPLYQRLAGIVAADDGLLAIAEHCRAGQQPTNLLFAAVHYLLLSEPGTPVPLAGWYRSLGGTRDPGDPALTTAFTDFCRANEADLTALVSRRLVQTNVVKRSAALRLGLAAIDEPGPVTLLEVGASGGIHLAFDAYRCRIGDTEVGPAGSPVRIETTWRSPRPVSTRIPAIGARLGLDLHPVDLADPAERRWLRALVWPENLAQYELLRAAAELVAARRPRILTGDAITALPRLDAELPADRPLVVWHAATRVHVPEERRPAFDAAIGALGRRRRLYTVSLETPDDAAEWYRRYGISYALQVRAGARPARRIAAADGHLTWIEPLSA